MLFALEVERDRRNPEPTDRVLLNPSTNTVMTRPRLYQRMLAVGKRAGVANAHPHRFRDTLAVDMLRRGTSPYDVAKMLGDSIDTVERHYTPFVPELRERVRSILENDVGLEEIGKLAPEFVRNRQKKVNRTKIGKMTMARRLSEKFVLAKPLFSMPRASHGRHN